MNDKTNLNTFDSPQVIVVEASAGSGKTRALAKRYLYLLMHSDFNKNNTCLREILAITFTNKATLEMKGRILEFLKQIALDAFVNPQEEKDIMAFLNIDRHKAKQKALLIMDSIIANYNFFQVQTIDSFINRLLLGCAIHIDRSASFKIKRNYEDNLAYCLDLVIEEAHSKKDVLLFLEKFLEHYLFVENREGWFPREDILGLMKSLFRLSNKYGKAFVPFDVEGLDVIKKKKHIYKQISSLAANLPEGFNANAKRSIIKFIGKNKDIFDTFSIPNALTNKCVPMNSKREVSMRFVKEWERVFRDLKEVIELEAQVAYKPYIQFFNKLFSHFQEFSKKQDILFLEELNAKTRSLFTENGITVAEAYYRLATRFKHYLVDEFQDTSSLQWENLREMVKEGLSTGGTFFYVGDKKQAIYRFRGGQVRLFDNVKNEFSHFGVKITNLTKNWRSQKEIVEFNNEIFSRSNLECMLKASGIADELANPADSEEILFVFNDSSQQYREDKNFGYVRIERINEKNQNERDEIIKEKVLNLIKDLKKRFHSEDIAILTRDNNEVELVTSWLLQEGLSVESEKTLNLLENYLIKEIIHFLRFLHSPIDDLSFSAFILGDVFTTISGISKSKIRDFLFNLKHKINQHPKPAIYKSFKEVFTEQWQDYINDFFQEVGFISPYELLVSIYKRFSLMNKFNNLQGFFMKFLELVKVNEEECPGLGDILKYLDKPFKEDLYVVATHSDSIKILTIHKAKGLEFPVVIIPFLRIDMVAETAGKGTNSHVVNEEGEHLGLMRITKTHRAISPLLQKIYAQDYKKACIDELNNIYVALTRPECELYAFIPKKSSNANNKVRFLIDEDVTIRGKQIKYKYVKKDKDACFIDIPFAVYKDWVESLRYEFGDKKEVVNREKIENGNFLHAAFSKIQNCKDEDLKVLIDDAVTFAQALYPFFKNVYVYREIIKKVIQDKDLEDIFYVNDGEVHTEREVVNKFGDLKRIDRIVVKNNQVWIIDYKASSFDESKNKEQISEYKKIIKEIYPDKLVRGFLVYLDEIRLEEFI